MGLWKNISLLRKVLAFMNHFGKEYGSMGNLLEALKTKSGWTGLLLAVSPLLSTFGVPDDVLKEIQVVLVGALGLFIRAGIIKETK